MEYRPRYSEEPPDPDRFSATQNALYSRWALSYDLLVKMLPIWRRWLRAAIPHIQGPRVLEVAFGTGYLLSQYAGNFETFGVDRNLRLAEIARKNLEKAGVSAKLQLAEVEQLPYPSGCFDSVVCTMALSAFPRGTKAVEEMKRVLRNGGKLIIIDVNYPTHKTWLGRRMTEVWMLAGDIIRDIETIFKTLDLPFSDEEIGGFGTIHLYTCCKSNGA